MKKPSNHEKTFVTSSLMPLQNTLTFSASSPLDKWDERFMSIAKEVQSWSKDPSTQCGCVLVRDRRIISTGYNGLPASLSDSLERYTDRDFKLQTIIHAEKNALFNAAKNGASTEGATAYVTWPPCTQCASALIQAGITKVICPDPKTGPERWAKNFTLANDLLYEAGVLVLYYGTNNPCNAKNALFVEPNGSPVNSTGTQGNLEKTKTSTHWSVEKLLPRRLRDA
jgi:dCMP deaminase